MRIKKYVIAAGWETMAFWVSVLFAWLFCCSVGNCFEPDQTILERAEKEFQEGVSLRQDREQARPHFRKAADYLEALRQNGVANALFYRNLGNAHLLADHLPQAILSYRRGLCLSPEDAVLRECLAEARQRVAYPPSRDLGRPQNENRPPWMPYVRTQWLIGAAFVCYVLGCVFTTRWRMVRRPRFLAGGIIFLVLSAFCGGWLVIRAAEDRDRAVHPLVVIARDGVLVRRGNSMAFPVRYDTPLNRGVEARLLYERAGWLQIQLFGGEIGWVPHEAALVDTP
jgi:tetratricopeptide (TPR) repeat protein